MRALRSLAAIACSFSLVGCQTTKSNFKSEQFSGETRALEKQLESEAVMLGTAQGVAGIAASVDPTGLASMATASAGLAARNAWTASANARMDAQLERDLQENYRRYGMNPDGTPSGKRPPAK